MDLYTHFREKYPDFYYHGYEIDEDEREVKVSYFFEIKSLSSFNPSWTFYKRTTKETFKNNPLFQNLVFSLGLVELVSYWKITCSPTVHVLPHPLSSEQVEWWKKLYFGGLGEFFFVNGIHPDFDSFMNVVSCGTPLLFEKEERELSGSIVAVGGGKDSAVSLEILAGEKDVSPFIINPRGATENTCVKAGFSKDDIHIFTRRLDPAMIELNKKGYLNGHTPFSAIVAFSSLIDAYITSRKFIVLSNESSANESTVQGSDVNHQFSKGFEFEAAFREYNDKYLKTDISYFSLLRPLSEFQIAMLFSRYKKYHDVFRSCNKGSKTDSWCCDCPKCLFVYIILSPFLSKEELFEIFGEDLFSKESLLENFKKLTGELPDKPFECVGSRDEITCALTLTLQRYEREGKDLPLLLAHFKKRGFFAENPRKYFDFYDTENFLTREFDLLLKNELLKG